MDTLKSSLWAKYDRRQKCRRPKNKKNPINIKTNGIDSNKKDFLNKEDSKNIGPPKDEYKKDMHKMHIHMLESYSEPALSSLYVILGNIL